MNDFESVWNNLLRKLKSGTIVKNWTAFGGYLGDSMTVTTVTDTYIVFQAPRAKYHQIVPKKDFKEVWRVWREYKTQKVKRYELRDITRFSKYIISLFHWYEEECK